MTSAADAYPFRVPCRFDNKTGQVVLDQLRTVDRERLVKKLGRLSPKTLDKVLALLREMFVP